MEKFPENNASNSSEWDDMAEQVDVEKRLEGGESPESIIKEHYEQGTLTPDFMEVYGSTLMQYGLNDDKYEYYEKLSRQHDDESPEGRRHRFDEEPEQEGFESEDLESDVA